MSEEQTLSRFGVNYYINGMSVYEMSRRLPDHYLSSTEAEYYACSIGTCEGKFLVMALTAMGETQSGPLLVGQDNKSCIQIAENPGRHHGRTKHIELRIRCLLLLLTRMCLILICFYFQFSLHYSCYALFLLCL